MLEYNVKGDERKMPKYEHANHRSRMRDRYASMGADFLNDDELLEMLLYYAIPRVDTAPIAAKLMETFGSYSAVLDANEKALLSIDGIGRHTVEFLGFIRSFLRRYKSSQREKPVMLKNSESLAKYLEAQFKNVDREFAYIGILGPNGEFLYGGVSECGDVSSVDVSIRRIAELCITQNATDYFIVHNHPSGMALPSRTDLKNSLVIENSLTAMGLIMRDHLIYANGDFCSMNKSNMLLRKMTREQIECALSE